MGVPEIIGTILGVHIMRTIILWGLYWGPPILGDYQISKVTKPEASTPQPTRLHGEIPQAAGFSVEAVDTTHDPRFEELLSCLCKGNMETTVF